MSRLLLRLAFLAFVVASWAQELISTHTVETLADDLQIQEWMRELRRVKRAPTRNDTQRLSTVVLGANSTGRCVLSADRASHFCGMEEEVSAPPIPPPDAGKCIISKASGREICYPRYEELDTTCTDVTGQTTHGLVAPPVVLHATVRAMAFVPPDNLRRLIIQYYRQQGRYMPKNATFSPRSFLFVKYHCDFGYEMIDEVDTLFCHEKQWINTLPVCRGKGLCEHNNGGCSHSCLSFNDEKVECKCPRGMVLDIDQKTCIKPIPKTLCRTLAGCSCSSIDDNQYSCTCPKGSKCLLLKGPPKIYVEPVGPYEVSPGGNINITCAAVAYPFPEIYWQRGNDEIQNVPSKAGTVKSEQILIIKELYKNAEFTCHANNSVGKVERTVKVTITGPGSAPVLRGAKSGRTSTSVRWDPPHIINRPITGYTVYYTNNGNQPIKNWKRIDVKEPNRDVEIQNLRPSTQYFIRLRANDQMGPGRLGNPVSVTTLKPASRPLVTIEQGDELRVSPLAPFELSCKITRADPVPTISWQHKGRPLNNGEKGTFMKMQHGGVIENTVYSCVAENEAGKSTKRINITVTGPTAPERIRYQVDGDKVNLQWEPPRITNGPMVGYEILYTTDPNLPEEQWQVD